MGLIRGNKEEVAVKPKNISSGFPEDLGQKEQHLESGLKHLVDIGFKNKAGSYLFSDKKPNPGRRFLRGILQADRPLTLDHVNLVKESCKLGKNPNYTHVDQVLEAGELYKYLEEITKILVANGVDNHDVVCIANQELENIFEVIKLQDEEVVESEPLPVHSKVEEIEGSVVEHYRVKEGTGIVARRAEQQGVPVNDIVSFIRSRFVK